MQTFRDFMESSLYAPETGYYEARNPKEDFYTAPELHPVFAELLAGEIARRFEELAARAVPGPYFIVEMGAGDGTLASGIARCLRERRPEWADSAALLLVERCGGRLVETVLRVAQTGVKTLGYARLEDVPACPGVFLSNELVDALPIHLLKKRDGEVLEVYVDERDGAFVETTGKISDAGLVSRAEAIAPFLREGERHSVNLEALRWIRAVSSRLSEGWLITIDYGKRFGSTSANPPRSYYRHTTDATLLTARPGRQDLTAPVDFDALIEEGTRRGLRLVDYCPLGRFLLERGILGRMPADRGTFDIEGYKERNRIKTLFHPEGMGEAFKVLIQEKRS